MISYNPIPELKRMVAIYHKYCETLIYVKCCSFIYLASLTLMMLN